MFIFFMVTAIIRLSRQSVLTTTKNTVFLQATSSHSYQSITNLDLRIIYTILSPQNPIKMYNNNSVIRASLYRKTLQNGILLIYYDYENQAS